MTLPVNPKESPKLSTRGYKTPSPGKIISKGITDSAKKVLKDLGCKEGDDSPKGGATGKKKIKKTALEQLKQVAWEAWKKPTKQDLDYETDEESD